MLGEIWLCGESSSTIADPFARKSGSRKILF